MSSSDEAQQQAPLSKRAAKRLAWKQQQAVREHGTAQDGAAQSTAAVPRTVTTEQRTAAPSEKQKPLAVQGTNDDATLSKRSAIQRGYYHDDYLQYFVTKPVQRAPLINRGYWLRVSGIRATLRHWIAASRLVSPSVQVVGLGAGFDTTYWCLRDEGVLQPGDIYAELDFPELVARKQALIDAAPAGFAPPPHPVPPFWLRGVDLTNLGQVQALLCNEIRLSPAVPTIFVAECVLAYIPNSAIVNLLAWARSTFSTQFSFLSFDQIRPSDSFGKLMCSRLATRGAPLLSIISPDEHLSRALSVVGFPHVQMFDLRAYWDRAVDEEERARIAGVEPFDEYADWFETLHHYLFTFASTSIDVALAQFPHQQLPPTIDSPSSPASASSSSSLLWQPAIATPSLPVWGSTTCLLRHDNSALVLNFGGFQGGPKTSRTDSLNLFELAGKGEQEAPKIHKVPVNVLSDAKPTARMFHTLSLLPSSSNTSSSSSSSSTLSWDLLLLGGRGSPTAAPADPHFLNVSLSPTQGWTATWKQPQSSNCPDVSARWRHTATALSNNRVFVFGGKTACSTSSSSAFLVQAHPQDCTLELITRLDCKGPSARHSHAAAALAEDRVLIVGGCNDSEQLLADAWIFDATQSAWLQSFSLQSPRAGHLILPQTASQFLLFGGWAPHSSRTASAALTAVRLCPDAIEENLVDVVLSDEENQQILAGGDVLALSDDCFLQVGGGVNAFSFGVHFNAMSYFHFQQAGFAWPRFASWPVVHSDVKAQAASSQAPPIACVDTQDDDLFWLEQFRQSHTSLKQPMILRRLNLGRCLDEWHRPGYWIERIGDVKASVHVCRDQKMSFVDRNFSFQVIPFSELIARIFANDDRHDASSSSSKSSSSEERLYFRSLGDNPRKHVSNVASSFPQIADDLVLPDCLLEAIGDRMFSSALRFSSPDCRLWTHYDVMDNFLFNIVGRKVVTLYPPDQACNLYPIGSSSPVVDIDNPDLVQFPRFALAQQTALRFVLEPGDTLFLPALWWHNVLALEPCISVNMFFKDCLVAPAHYPTKDLYGNKDLVPALSAFKHVEAALKDIASMPPSYREFYQSYLLGMLQGTAKPAI